MFIQKFAFLMCPIIALAIISVTVTAPRQASVVGDKMTVVIDAGHGGVDGGVEGVNSKVKESDLNLKYAMLLKKLFEQAAFNVVMTRQTSAGLYGAFSKGFKQRDLKERMRIANGVNADLFISVHMNNYSDKSRRGAQVFYKIGDEKSKSLAEYVQESLNDMKESVRACSTLAGDYYVLNNCDAPAVLCECGFLSSPEDEKLLLDDLYAESLTSAVFFGCVEYLNQAGQTAYQSTT